MTKEKNVKMFTMSNMKESESLAVLWLRHMTDYTLLPAQSLFAVHDVRDKHSPLSTTTDKPSWEVNKKLNILVFLS